MVTSVLLYLVNWDYETEKAQELVLKADLKDALLEKPEEPDQAEPPLRIPGFFLRQSINPCNV